MADIDDDCCLNFGEHKALSKIFHNDFEESAENKKHIVITSKSLTREQLLDMKLLRNPYITKEIFTSDVHHKTLIGSLTEHDREFLEKNSVVISSLGEGGLKNYIDSSDLDCDERKLPLKSFYVEGGPMFFHNMLSENTSPRPADMPVDYFIMTRRYGANLKLASQYLVGKEFYTDKIERVFQEFELSKIFEKDNVTYKVASYINRDFALRLPEKTIDDVRQKNQNIQEQLFGIVGK